MQKYEVGLPFPIHNEVPGVDRCTARLTGASFDVLYYISGANSREIKTFKDTLLRLHVWIYDDIPFIAVSYLGETWTYDITLTVATRDKKDVSQAFIEGKGNAVTLFLIDATTNVILAMRTLGLTDSAAATIKEAARAQLERYEDEAAILTVVNRVYAELSTADIIARGDTYEFKRK